MQHCLGQFADRDRLEGGYGEYYASACEEGRLRLFSLRDASNRPHVTISLIEDFGEWSVGQIKGKQNATPTARYLPDVLALLNTLRPRPNDSVDLSNLGAIPHALPAVPGKPVEFGYKSFAEMDALDEQHDLIAVFPHLASQLRAPDPRTQWLALAAGNTLADAGGPRHAAVTAAIEISSSDDLPDASWPEDVFARHFPGMPDLLSADGEGWLARLSGSSTRQRRRKWALAVAEPQFFRHAGTGMTRSLKLSTAFARRQQAQICEELGLGRDGREAVTRFRRNFFYCPSFRGLAAIRGDVPGKAWQLLAAHAMRQSYLLRFLVVWGLVEAPLAWSLLLLNAQRVRACFDGWTMFGLAAARGRTSLVPRSADPRAEPNMAALVEWDDFQRSSAVWKKLNWSSFDLSSAA
ncbi:hypothetical protein [Paraburkholderia dinghuensis]|nr:hypothetical protein [Paraburkholderia dinghuensis]